MQGRLRQVSHAKSHRNRIEIAWKIACVNGPLDCAVGRKLGSGHIKRVKRWRTGGVPGSLCCMNHWAEFPVLTTTRCYDNTCFVVSSTPLTTAQSPWADNLPGPAESWDGACLLQTPRRGSQSPFLQRDRPSPVTWAYIFSHTFPVCRPAQTKRKLELACPNHLSC